MRRSWLLPSIALVFAVITGCGADSEGGQTECAGIRAVCSADSECLAGASCDECGRCVAAACADDSDCAGDLRCVAGSCKAEACTSDAACGAGRLCIDGACIVDDCTVAGCPDGKSCRVQDKTCVECISEADCTSDPAAPWCETDSGNCVACRTDGDCTGQRCGAANRCVECVSNDDCSAPTPTCRTDVGVCGTCATDTDCPGSFCREDATCWPGPEEGEACNPDGTCAPGLICAGDTCRTLCDLYDDACPSGTDCEILASEGRALFVNGKPLAACLDTSTGVGAERPCGGEVFCKAGLFCVPTSADGGTCKPYCDPVGQAENCATGDVCVPVELGAEGQEIGLCNVPNTWLESCIGNSDCDAGQGCVPFVEGTAVVGRCQFAGGTGAALAPCDANADCRSGFCLPLTTGSTAGYCWGGCTDDAACGTDGLCVEYTFTINATGGTATYDGCRAACTVDADCAAYGAAAICTVGVADEQLAGVCAARRGAAGPGDTCTTDAACATGICFANDAAGHPADDGYCLGPCAVDADCGANTSCRPVALNAGEEGGPVVYDTMDMCWGGACARHADCPADWACTLSADPADPENSLRTSCYPAYGTGAPGAPCTQDSQCLTNICADFGTAQVCWGPCVNDGDCVLGASCVPVIFNQTSQQTGCLP